MYHSTFRTTRLWNSAFHAADTSQGNQQQEELKRRLIAAHDIFRDKASVLAAEISRDLPHLTDHSVTHLDALWVIADEIAGTDFTINPLEAFIFGGAVLLHDLGNTLAAFPNRIEDLKGAKWNDHVVSSYIDITGTRPSDDEIKNPCEEVINAVLFARLREEHASAANRLATQGFANRDMPDHRLYLIEDQQLREQYGEVIGQIAASHHWPIHLVERDLRDIISGVGWHGWEVDPLKLACLLRCADACHLDVHRASTFQMILREPKDESRLHWRFQNRIRPPRVNDIGELEFRSISPFGITDREAWWLAYDTIRNGAHKEIRDANRTLQGNCRQRLRATGVAGADNPEDFRQYLTTREWQPVNIAVRITDVTSVIERFGGRKLYGSTPTVPLRELIANAADATRARRYVNGGGLQDRQGQVIVRVGSDDNGHWLEVEDEGVGMSEDVLRGPLLDFGQSFWGSNIAVSQFPGLTSSSFRPTGRFGIGFFSVFMIASHVKVTTRRFVEGAADTKVLEMSRGFRYPLLRSVDPRAFDESLPRGGTKVRLLLDSDPWAASGFLASPAPPAKEGDVISQELKPKMLAALVSRIAPAVDVDLCVEVDSFSGEHSRICAVAALDWITIDFEALLNRLGQPPLNSHPVTRHVCEPSREGALLGRIRLVTPDRTQRSALVVGGLAARWNTRYFEGIVVGDDPPLSRNEGEPLLTTPEFAIELQRTVDAGFTPEHPVSPDLATFFLDHGVLPLGLHCFETPDKLMDYDDLKVFAGSIRTVVIVADDTFFIDNEIGPPTELTVSENFDRIHFTVANVVLALGLIREEDIDINDPSASASGTPRSVPGLAIRAVCEAWNVHLDEVECDQGILTLGYIVSGLGSRLDVSVECVILKRSSN